MSVLLYGSIIHAPTIDGFEIMDPGVVLVGSDGVIKVVQKAAEGFSREDLASQYGLTVDQVQLLPSDGFLLPGFVDTHVHAPQYVFTGTGYDLPLLDWLNKYTFPRESAFKDLNYARDAYQKAVIRLLRSGTTTACYYGTIHRQSCEILAETMVRFYQRGFVGKVNMDQNSPEWYCESTDASVEDTVQFLNAMSKLDPERSLVAPVITPRFAPTCSAKLQSQLSQLAVDKQLLVQTHISENKKECEWVHELFPDCKSYSDVYEKFGLLSSRTVLAHAIYLSESERELIKAKKVGISHCPTSNFCLKSGVLNLRELLREGQKVGLGTDVSGGYSPSILVAMRDAITASKLTEMSDSACPSLQLHEAFYLATLGGAEVLNLADKVGSFAVGKEFDAQVIDPRKGNTIDLFPHDSLLEKLEKWVYNGDDRQVVDLFVKGHRILV